MPPTTVVRRILLGVLLTAGCSLAAVASAATSTRCSDESDAGAVVQRANAPARRSNAPSATPTAHDHEPGAAAHTPAPNAPASAATIPAAGGSATLPTPLPAPLAQKALTMHDTTAHAVVAPARRAAVRRAPAKPVRLAPAATGMKTLVELSQSGGRIVG